MRITIIIIEVLFWLDMLGIIASSLLEKLVLVNVSVILGAVLIVVWEWVEDQEARSK